MQLTLWPRLLLPRLLIQSRVDTDGGSLAVPRYSLTRCLASGYVTGTGIVSGAEKGRGGGGGGWRRSGVDLRLYVYISIRMQDLVEIEVPLVVHNPQIPGRDAKPKCQMSCFSMVNTCSANFSSEGGEGIVEQFYFRSRCRRAPSSVCAVQCVHGRVLDQGPQVVDKIQFEGGQR